eukprot:TRINITY_DN2316_c0_g1_i1.p2 TRINITY_DN2316_c0_g1~~TRINITY_DN2316_c0_g1_i1.p2  ORF type:complete len:132 (-),score=24.07 TRINITY_DN2316_c0_g1_i1:264-659(-)
MNPTAFSNPSPMVYEVGKFSREQTEVDDETTVDPIDALEIFELLRRVNDPEHPLTLEQLNVIKLENIHVNNESKAIQVHFTPTIPHCSMATLIGLCLRVKLLRSLPDCYKVDVEITPGTHNAEDSGIVFSF